MNNRQHEVDETVRSIRQSSDAHFFRDPDRATSKILPVRRRQPPEVVKAKSQRRTAAWRSDCDRLRRPEARDIGMAMVASFVTSDFSRMTRAELRFVAAAFDDLEARGFDRAQIRIVMRRMRDRLVEDDDRHATVDGLIAPESDPTKYF